MSPSAVVTISVVLCAVSASVVASKWLSPKNGSKIDHGKGTRQTSYYFLSQNSANWYTAASDCKANLGEGATLLNIETDEQLAEVIRLFETSDGTGSTYWTGGSYDEGKKTFVWSSGKEINPSAPWDAGHPNSMSSGTCVFAYTVGGLKLRTELASVLLRYICVLVK